MYPGRDESLLLHVSAEMIATAKANKAVIEMAQREKERADKAIAELATERKFYADKMCEIISATGINLPAGGMTALEAVKALRQSFDDVFGSLALRDDDVARLQAQLDAAMRVVEAARTVATQPPGKTLDRLFTVDANTTLDLRPLRDALADFDAAQRKAG